MTAENSLTDSIKVWKPVEQFVNDNHQFSEHQIRWLIRNRQYNGFDGVLRKVGKRWYINESIFANWLSDNQSVS